MPRSNPQQDEKYCSCDPRQTHGDFHNKIGQQVWPGIFHTASWFGPALPVPAGVTPLAKMTLMSVLVRLGGAAKAAIGAPVIGAAAKYKMPGIGRSRARGVAAGAEAPARQIRRVRSRRKTPKA